MNLDSPAALQAFLAGLAVGLFLTVGIQVLIGLKQQRRSEDPYKYGRRQSRPHDAHDGNPRGPAASDPQTKP